MAIKAASSNLRDNKVQRGRRYIDCYCDKHAHFLVGVAIYKYLNLVLGIPSIVLLFALVLLAGIPILAKLGAVTIMAFVLVLLSRYYYLEAKRIMLQAGHTEACSRRMGWQAMIHGGGYSDFKIMNSKTNK